MSHLTGYTYEASVKSDVSDEWINVHVVRPLAGVLVRGLYHTSVTPNQVTVAATLIGVAAAALYLPGTHLATACAGLLLTLKDIMDSADGQLARAKALYSRVGRFLDSIGDCVVNVVVFGAIAHALGGSPQNPLPFALGVLGFLGLTLRVSYHVYYQTQFLHLQGSYSLNRPTEEVRPEDKAGDVSALRLQQVFQVCYGWQDALMVFVDRWSRRGIPDTDVPNRLWYGDERALRLTGVLGLGTELAVLMVFSVFDALLLYLYFNVFLLNTVWLLCMFYRRIVLSHRVRRMLHYS
jgi:hypothetical protein